MNRSHVHYPKNRSIIHLDRWQCGLPTLLGHCRTAGYWRRLEAEQAAAMRAATMRAGTSPDSQQAEPETAGVMTQKVTEGYVP